MGRIAQAIGGFALAGASFAALFIPGMQPFALAGLKLAVGLGLSIGLGALRQQQVASPIGGSETQIKFGGAVPCQMNFGKVLTAGQVVYWNTYGGSATPNRHLQLVHVLGDGQHEALDAVWVDGEKHALTSISIPVGGTEHARYTVDGYGSNFLIKWYDGRYDQNADPDLTTHAVATTTGFKWNVNCRGRGRCYVSIELEYQSELFPNGIPDIEYEIRGNRLYDARFDTSVGGSGTQRFITPSTWVYTDNPAVALAHYRRGLYVSGVRLAGMGWPAADLSQAHYNAAANNCDEDVTLTDASVEDRYNVSMIALDDVQHRDNIEALHQAMAGYEVERAGVMAVYPGASQVSVATITDDDLRVGQQLQWQHKTSREQSANRVVGSYTEPKQHWQLIPYPPKINATWETEDGELLETRFDLPMVISKTQAERVRNIRASETRLQARGTVTVGYHVLTAEAGDWITWNSALFGNRKYLIERDVEQEDGSLTWDLRETHEDAYSGSGLDGNPYDDPPGPIITPPASNVSGLIVQASTVSQGAVDIPAIDVLWTPPGDPRILAVIIEYRVTGTLGATRVRDDSPEDGIYQIKQGIVGGLNYEVRVTIVTDPPRVTTWSAWTGVLTNDVNPWGDIDIGDLELDLDNLDKYAHDQAKELLKLAGGLTGLASLWTAHKILSQRLSVTYQGFNASVNKLSFAVANADEVLAGQITTFHAQLRAELGGQADVVQGVIARVTLTEAGIVALTQSIDSFTSRLTDAEGDITGLGDAINFIETRVEDINGVVTATAVQLQSVFAQVGHYNAGAAFAIRAEATSGGAKARVSLRVKAGTDADYRAASMFFEAFDTPTQKYSQTIFVADRTLFATQVGGKYLQLIRITADKIEFTQDVQIDGSLIIKGSVTQHTSRVIPGSITVAPGKTALAVVTLAAHASKGGVKDISGGFSWTWQGSASTPPFMYLSIYRNDVLIYEIRHTLEGYKDPFFPATRQVTINFVDASTIVGNFIYELRARTTAFEGKGVTSDQRFLRVLELVNSL